jgi:hypothetical protein
VVGMFCVVALLLATLHQAAHLCAMVEAPGSPVVTNLSTAANGAPCLTCLMSANAAAPVFLLLLGIFFRPRKALVPATARGWHRSLFDRFPLFLRPPPAN